MSDHASDHQFPQTPEEWRDAAAAAKACLLIDAARHYGLINGGPIIYVERCEDVLAVAAERGIDPTQDEVDAAIAALVAA